jgi:hypothetical protein
MGLPLGDYVARVTLRGHADDGRVQYAAAAPPDYRASFSGSGLPHPSAAQAFHNTPNRGTAAVAADGSVQVRLLAPAPYYTPRGQLVPPTLHVLYASGGRRVREAHELPDAAVPFRSLAPPAERASRGADFYAWRGAGAHALARSQHEILLASAFPGLNRQPSDFWGGRPPA